MVTIHVTLLTSHEHAIVRGYWFAQLCFSNIYEIMKSNLLTATLLAITLLSSCKKERLSQNPLPNPVPLPTESSFSVRVKAVLKVGDVVYDSIPAMFTITTWDADGVAHAKDTLMNPGEQLIYLPKTAVRYSLKLNKWGISDEKLLNKSEVVEGALYQLGGQKGVKKLQSVTEYSFINGAFAISAKQDFIYDNQGQINEIHAYSPDPNTGVLRSGSSDVFLYGSNQLWVNNISKSDGTIFSHTAFTFDAQGRIIHSKYEYLTQKEAYTIQYTSEGILMLRGQNATDPNGSRIALRFAGGNRVEEKTIFPNLSTTVKNFRYDFNINPYVVIKMPSLYFEHSSKNNVAAEGWDGSDQLIHEYTYDVDGYVTEVITKTRNNSGQFVNYTRTVYTY